MKKNKISLTQDDLKIGPNGLMKKYGLSSRGHAHHVLQKGYFWENAHDVQENFSPQWVEENFEDIKREVYYAVRFKSSQKGLFSHRLYEEFKEDLYQDGLLYVIQRAGDIESGKSKLCNIAKTGVGLAIQRYFMYRDGKNDIAKMDFWDDKGQWAGTPEEESIDSLFLQVKEEIISSLGEDEWESLWNWALSRKTKCPTEVMTKLEEVGL